MFQFTKIQPASIADMKTSHLEELSAPQDCYWQQALIGLANHYRIESEGQTAGYLCINGKNQLVDYYLQPVFQNRASEILKQALTEFSISSGFAGSNDAIYFCSSLELSCFQKSSTLLFQDEPNSKLSNAPSPELDFDLRFRKAIASDFDEIVNLYVSVSESTDQQSVEGVYGSMKSYAEQLIQSDQLFLMENEDQKLLAISEIRVSQSQLPYADVGMIVSLEFRRKGLGSFILSQAKNHCREKELLAICSCEESNPGSKKAIENAGFVCKNRIFEFQY